MNIINLLVACSSQRASDVQDRSTIKNYSGKIHTVNRGETLFSIAFRYGIDYKKLAEFNAIKPPYTIYPAQQLKVDVRSDVRSTKNNNVARGKSTDNSAVATKEGSSPSNSSFKNRSNKETKNSGLSSQGTYFSGTPKWQWPASGKLIALFQGEIGFNKGIDLGGNLGEPVLAAASGQVVYAGGGLSSYGKLLIIKHNDSFLSAYAHNKELLVKEGDFVKAGQRIADMGSSGTDRVKLHFEIRSEGSPVDPLDYLPKR